MFLNIWFVFLCSYARFRPHSTCSGRAPWTCLLLFLKTDQMTILRYPTHIKSLRSLSMTPFGVDQNARKCQWCRRTLSLKGAVHQTQMENISFLHCPLKLSMTWEFWNLFPSTSSSSSLITNRCSNRHDTLPVPEKNQSRAHVLKSFSSKQKPWVSWRAESWKY